MIRQNAFNAMFRGYDKFNDSREEIIKLYVAYRMTNAIAQRGILAQAVVNAKTSIALQEFSVAAGMLRVNYYEPREDDLNGSILDFENGLVVEFHNTWVSPKAAEEPGEDEKKPDDRLRTRARREQFEASRSIDNIDLGIIRGIYEQALNEILTLLADHYTSAYGGVREPNLNLAQGVIYNLGERDRVNAAWHFLEYVKLQSTKADEDLKDIRIRHIVSGVTEFGYSGHYGNEQQWVKANTRRGHGVSGSSRENEEYNPALTRDEQGFLEYFRDHVETARDPESVERRRGRNHY